MSEDRENRFNFLQEKMKKGTLNDDEQPEFLELMKSKVNDLSKPKAQQKIDEECKPFVAKREELEADRKELEANNEDVQQLLKLRQDRKDLTKEIDKLSKSDACKSYKEKEKEDAQLKKEIKQIEEKYSDKPKKKTKNTKTAKRTKTTKRSNTLEGEDEELPEELEVTSVTSVTSVTKPHETNEGECEEYSETPSNSSTRKRGRKDEE